MDIFGKHSDVLLVDNLLLPHSLITYNLTIMNLFSTAHIPVKNALISNREKSVLELIAAGMTSEDIAVMLFISSETVNSHRKNMLRKLDVPNSASLIRRAFDLGILLPKGWRNH